MSKLSYERPFIQKLNTGTMNKFGTKTALQPVTQIDGVPIKRIIAEHGSPCYVISERTIRNTYKDALRAFKTRYPKIQFFLFLSTKYIAIKQIIIMLFATFFTKKAVGLRWFLCLNMKKQSIMVCLAI